MQNGFIKSDVRVHFLASELKLSLEQILISILNLVAAIASFRSGWKATAISSSATDVVQPPEPLEDAVVATGYEVTD